MITGQLILFKCPFAVSKTLKTSVFCRSLRETKKTMRILNVAEKNDAAKNIAHYLSKGRMNKREGFSKYNKIYDFDCEVMNSYSKMTMTSVSGHVMQLDFLPNFRSWSSVDPITLFEAPVKKKPLDSAQNIKKSLEAEAKNSDILIIWTDCDREGENIGFEIIDICKNVQPSLKVYRAKFSEITGPSVTRALKNLSEPNQELNDAVNVRMELDLRIGAAFTRFQSLHLQKAFPEVMKDSIISYGSCQFPTLGFVIDRFKAISQFVSEPFWKINVTHTVDSVDVNFEWKRNHLFDKLSVQVLFDKCIEAKKATVMEVKSNPKKKYRPKPLDTVELEKLASRKLKINAKETLRIAEKLYSRGLISYPRTETNIFPKELNLVPLVEMQRGDPMWGEFAGRVLNDKPNPFQGSKSDLAHPPIHPTKYTNNLSGNEKSIYEFIVRHFLACLSEHAEGLETTVLINIADEEFVAKGLMIIAKNYLDVYPYETWSEKEIHIYREKDTFIPNITMLEGKTNPPELLTEADLITLMEKHGIGTDATHADHIETIKSRFYIGVKNDKYFVPRTLGMGLVEGYSNMGYEMSKPHLRADLEADLKRISEKQKSPGEVLTKHIKNYKNVFEGVRKQVNKLSQSIETFIQVDAQPVSDLWNKNNDKVMKCNKCNSIMMLKKLKNGKLVISCSNFPLCQNSIWLPSIINNLIVTNETCSKCGPDFHLLKFTFETGSCYLPKTYKGCIGGCDSNLSNVLKLNSTNSKNSVGEVAPKSERSEKSDSLNFVKETTNNDSGFGSFKENTPQSYSDNQNFPDCHCGRPSVIRNVAKSGPNFGRSFYSCYAQNNSKCNFFKWVDSCNTNHNVNINSKELSKQKDAKLSFENDVRCFCAMPSRRFFVSKEGPNKGRQFLSCSKANSDTTRCDFFKWLK